jgi:allantoate deiminase
MAAMAYARTVLAWCDALRQHSEETDQLTRRFATPAMQQANAVVAGWMRNAGMTVHQDNIGNLRGRYPTSRSDAPTLLLGSHLDTVRNAGKYDGTLGVLVALACVQQLHDDEQRLPFAIEIVAFANEEGLRYPTAYLGSTVFAGTFDPAQLDLVDGDGISLREAIRRTGGDPTALSSDMRSPHDLLGYLEVHIEQGPVLEAQNLSVGIVSAIQGQSRFALRFAGEAGHAGTVPMALRRDALCAAAEFILDVEQVAQEHAGLVATVGHVSAQPGASNVIPGDVTLSLDVRHPTDAVRHQACAELHERATSIGARRKIDMTWEVLMDEPSVACDQALAALLAQATEAQGYSVLHLPSGAGHDGVAIAQITPMAMLFVRCTGGVSHNPAEAVTTDDVAAAIAVVRQFWTLVAQTVATDR